MAKGAFYPIYNELNLYANAAQANAYGTPYASTLSPNTGPDSAEFNVISSAEGKGNLYVDTSWGLHSIHYPAFSVWFVPTWGGVGYQIGWTNDSKNLGASTPTLNKSEMDSGETVRITTNRLNASFTHTVQWRYDGAWNNIGTGVGVYVDWTPTHAQIAGALPADKRSGVFTIRVITYNGAENIGEKTITITISVPANQFTIGNFTIGASAYSIPVTISKSYAGYTSRISLYFGSAYIGYWDTAGTSITLTPANANDGGSVMGLLNKIPESVSGMFTFKCRTLNGEISLLTVDKTAKGTAHEDIKPFIGSIGATEASELIKTTLGLNYFVQHYSEIKATATGVTAGLGSTIDRYSWQLADKRKYDVSPTFAPTKYLNPMFKLTVWDKRGRSFSLQEPITLEAYAKPIITLFKATRYNPSNQAKVNIDLKAEQTKLSDKNTMRYKIEARPESSQVWEDRKAWSAFQIADINLSATNISDIANDGRWKVRVTIEDLIGSVSQLTIDLDYSRKAMLRFVGGDLIEALVDFEVDGKKVHGVTDVSDEFTIVGSGVSTLTAFRTGQVAVVRFKYTPPSGGYKTGMITSTLPATQLTSGSAYPDSSADMTKPVIPYIGTTGTIALVATSASGAHNCSITYIVQEGS